MDPAAPRLTLRNARPPLPEGTAPRRGAAGSIPLRRTVHLRPDIVPLLWDDPVAILGYAPQDPYVRRYWTAVLGPGAVADLLRLIAAACRDRSLARPLHLAALAREDLVRLAHGRVLVRATVPPLGPRQVRRLPPPLRREHADLRWATAHRPGAA